MHNEDIRWKQRFNNFVAVYQNLHEANREYREGELSSVGQMGLARFFNQSYNLAWKVLKDYLEEQGIFDLVGPKQVIREAFKNNLINDGQVWMDMLDAQIKIANTIDKNVISKIANDIATQFFSELEIFSKNFTLLYEELEV